MHSTDSTAPSASPLVCHVFLPPPPAAGPERLRWWKALDAALEVDLLQARLSLRRDGLAPAQIELEMLHGYRPWLLSRIGAVIDGFAIEVAWNAS